jgi:hypothetical protein
LNRKKNTIFAGFRHCNQLGVLVFLLCCALFSPLSAETKRAPANFFLIIDGSAALENGRDEAFDWVSGRVVDGLLREGDSLTIWVAGDKAEELFSGTVAGSGTKEAVKALIRGIAVKDKKADYLGALRMAAKRAGTDSPGSRLCYTLLISGMSAGYTSFAGGEEMFEFLRYSRFEEFPFWCAVTVALGIEAGVKKAAAAFIRNSR